MAVAGLDQVGQEHLGSVDHTPEVDVHDSFDVFELADLDIAGERDTGVVVDLVDLAEVRLDLIGVGAERLALGDVEAIGFDVDPDGLEAFLGDGQTFGVDIADRDAGTRSAQFDGQCLADTRPGAGDDGDLPGEPCMSAPLVRRVSNAAHVSRSPDRR